MLRFPTLGTLSMLTTVLTASVLTPGAQPEKTAIVARGPVPAQILTAKSAFIANAGAECNPAGTVGFSEDADRAYDEFYAAMKAWCR